MYLRAIHADATIPMVRRLIRDNPLGILTTAIASQSYPLIQSSHIPFLLDVEDEASDTELGVLRGHLARQNPQTKAMIESLQSQGPMAEGAGVLEQEVMVLFNSPVQHYVTPQFYPEIGCKQVPTWNYAAAQAYGRARIYYDSKSEETAAFLVRQLNDLSRYGEESIMGYTGEGGTRRPWLVSDAPEQHVQRLQKNIIGIEIVLDRLEGKFKMSQELGQVDREGVIKGFEDIGSELGHQMAQLVQERGRIKDARSR